MAGVYISYPFCAQKCTYCNFASGVFPRALEMQYLAKLASEIQNTVWAWTPETVFLGGGTPSLISGEALGGLLAAIPGRPWREATIEVAPGSLTEEQVSAWQAAGINRLSFGTQSFNLKELVRTGRRHNPEIVESEIAMVRREGFSNINLDLIAGLPGQTMESWRESLDWIEKLAVPHVSVYMLEVDEDSRLGREIIGGGQRYGARDIPDENAIADFYEYAVDRLHRLGIERYEISNFARPGFESAHNLKYWRREPYLGFGADAHSFDGEVRWQNAESAMEYVTQNGRPIRESANATAEQWFLGLRLREGIAAQAAFVPAIQKYMGDGLLEEIDGRVRLTNRGVLLSNEIFAEFV